MTPAATLTAASRELLSLLAFIYMENNRPEKAAALLSALEAMNAGDPRSRCTLALAELRAGKPGQALKTLETLALRDPPSAAFHLIRAGCLHELHQPAEAAAAMRAYLALRRQESAAGQRGAAHV